VIFFSVLCLSGSNVGGNLSFEGTEDGECQSNIKHDTSKTRTDSFIITDEAILLVDRCEAVTEALVFTGIDTLHFGLDNIDRVVKHGRAETSEATSHKITKNFSLNVGLQEFLGIFEYHKTNTLVGGLLHESGKVTFIETTRTMFGGDTVNTMEKISVFGGLLELVVNESSFEGLLRSNNKGGLCGTSANTTHKVVELVAGSKYILLNILVGTKADIVLGDGEQEQGRVTSVKTKESICLDGVSNNINSSLFVLIREQLHDGLGVFSWVGARDLEGTSNTTNHSGHQWGNGRGSLLFGHCKNTKKRFYLKLNYIDTIR